MAPSSTRVTRESPTEHDVISGSTQIGPPAISSNFPTVPLIVGATFFAYTVENRGFPRRVNGGWGGGRGRGANKIGHESEPMSVQ